MDQTMPNMRDVMVAEIERTAGGHVFTVPPVVTGKGWRATLRGGELGLLSVTLVEGTEQDAVTALMSLVVDARDE